jgi:8-oxo-dGTP pyrophosphatase MutT (NUDIX family)
VHSNFSAEIEDLARRYGSPLRRRVVLDDCSFKPLAGGRTAEVAMIIRRRNGLMLTARKRYYPSHISRLLTGGIEPNETIEAALLREVYEETNLEAAVTRFAAILEYVHLREPTRPRFLTFAFLLNDVGGILQNNDDEEQLDAFLEVSAQELPEIGRRLSALPAEYDPEIGGRWQAWGAFRSPLHQITAEFLLGAS